MTIQQQFLAIDEGRQRLSLVDTTQNSFVWTLSLHDYPLARDMQRLDAERALIGYDKGFFEIDIASGRVLCACARWTEVTAVRRLPDGSTLVTGFNLDGSGGINVLTLDAALNLVHTARRDGDYVRLMRPTLEGTYLLCMNDHILETTPALEEVRRFATAGFEHAWKAERRADGTTLVSAGYGAFMALFDAGGECTERFGQDESVSPFFFASFEELANGNLLVANWQGHGEANGAKGRQLLEFGPDRRLLGHWSAPEHISSLQGLLVV